MYKVYELKEDGEIGKLLDITNDFDKWEKKFKNFEVLICCVGLFDEAQ